VPDLWIPGVDGPHDDFVERLVRLVERFARDAGVERAYVEVELDDSSRFSLDSVSPEPGYGFVTLKLHGRDEPQVPDELVVPIGSIKRIELSKAEDRRGDLGFSLPPPVL
jgi:hypothetical protein